MFNDCDLQFDVDHYTSVQGCTLKAVKEIEIKSLLQSQEA